MAPPIWWDSTETGEEGSGPPIFTYFKYHPRVYESGDREAQEAEAVAEAFIRATSIRQDQERVQDEMSAEGETYSLDRDVLEPLEDDGEDEEFTNGAGSSTSTKKS